MDGMENLTPSDVVQGEVVDRVYAAHGLMTEGLAYLKVKHVVIFPTSWILYFLLGRWFFESVLGRYHATSARYWAKACKLIFLLTFVAACNLLNLMVAEVYGFMHPALRTVAWTCTLALLTFLLNNIIPFLAAVSMGRTLGLPRLLAGFLGMGIVVVAQIWFWFIGETFISDKSETWHDHNSVSIIFFLYQQLLLKDLEHSVAIIAMMGTFISALIAGFATISFPMDSLMIFRGVNAKLLRTKENTHVEMLFAIASRKRCLLLATMAEQQREIADSSAGAGGRAIGGAAFSPLRLGASSSDALSAHSSASNLASGAGASAADGAGAVKIKNRRGTSAERGGGAGGGAAGGKKKGGGIRASISLSLGKITKGGTGEYRELFKDLARSNNYLRQWGSRLGAFFARLWRRLDSFVDHVIINVSSVWARKGYQVYQWHPAGMGPGGRGDKNGGDVAILEHIASDLFLDIVHSHELREQAEFSQTKLGTTIWAGGIFLSFVGVVRLCFALDHVRTGLYSPGYIPLPEEEEMYFANVMMDVLGMDRRSYDLSANLFIIFLLGAFQIRAFLGSMMISARLGFLSTNTELYALVLAYLAGFYFVASVVLLRIQLPMEYRKGVTLALGQFGFDYFEWLFDRIYIASSCCSLLYLWRDSRRKATASKRFFTPHDT